MTIVTCHMVKKPETISISEFKATCLSVLDRVRRTGAPIVVTRRGIPIAEVIPPTMASARESWLGSMSGTAVIAGDLVAPATSAEEWDVLKP